MKQIHLALYKGNVGGKPYFGWSLANIHHHENHDNRNFVSTGGGSVYINSNGNVSNVTNQQLQVAERYKRSYSNKFGSPSKKRVKDENLSTCHYYYKENKSLKPDHEDDEKEAIIPIIMLV
jgi:hypothetical protein